MTSEARAALRDKVARAIWETNSLNVFIDAAIDIVLEEAAKLAEAKADEWATVWRNRMKADSHMEGQSDGADEIASAIRALKENSNDRHS